MAKEYFREKGIEFTEKDVADDTVARNEMVQKSGQLGVPTICLGGEIVVGFNKAKIEQFLG